MSSDNGKTMEGKEEMTRFVRESSVSIAELLEHDPGRIHFHEMPGMRGLTLPYFPPGVSETEIWFPVGSFRIANGVFAGAHGITCLQGEGGPKILREQNTHTKAEESLLVLPNPCREDIPRLNSAVSLVSAASYCFFHWFLDSLPKILVAEACGFTGTYLVPTNNTNPWVAETLNMAGIDPGRALPMDYRSVQVAEVWVPAYFDGCHLRECPAFYRRIREWFLSSVRGTRVEGRPRLFIPRKPGPTGRSLINHDEVEALLARYGFQTVYMEDYSVREQIAMASKASAMIGPHGSGMLHCIFMPESSWMLEMFSTGWIAHCMRDFARVSGHQYESMVTPAEDDRMKSAGVRADIEKLRDLLKKKFGEVGP